MASALDDLPAEYARFRVLGSKQSAEFCGFSEEHWRRLHRDGKTPRALKLSDRKLGWTIGALVEWQAERISHAA